MKTLFQLLLFISFLLTSCKKNKISTIHLNFETEVSGAPVQVFDAFTDNQGRSIRFELMKFYLSNLSFIDKNGEVFQANEIALMDLSMENSSSLNFSIPSAKYTAIQFGVGVPKELNEMDPSSFSEDNHPLSTTQGTYWGMNSLYRFAMFDGRYDLEADGIFDGTFSYHTGHNEAYRLVTLNKNYNFKNKETYNITIGINISKIIDGVGGNIDIVNESNYHGDTDDQHLATMISDNFVSAFTINE